MGPAERLQLQLISIYCWLDDSFERKGVAYLVERFGPGKPPEFTDVELLSAYLFARLQGFTGHKKCWEFIDKFHLDWFPELPRYSSWVERLLRLEPAMPSLLESLLLKPRGEAKRVVDSCPVVVCSARRSKRSKTAEMLADTGYCGTKRMFYRGVKLHVVAHLDGSRSVPYPLVIGVSRAGMNDIDGLRQIIPDLHGGEIWFDKAYRGKDDKTTLEGQGCGVRMPRVKHKGLHHFKGRDTLNYTISRERQPIETLFSWLSERTGFQDAHKVRSARGLLFFIWSCLIVGIALLNDRILSSNGGSAGTQP